MSGRLSSSLGQVPIARPLNRDAQRTHNVNALRLPPFDLTGQGIKVGIWDGGAVLGRHLEFGNRVKQGDGATNINRHPTHVAGTIAAAGKNPEAEGMAPRAELYCYDWDNDVEEMIDAAR